MNGTFKQEDNTFTLLFTLTPEQQKEILVGLPLTQDCTLRVTGGMVAALTFNSEVSLTVDLAKKERF
jgi:hypothetical protein